MSKKHENDPRSGQKRPQEEPKTIKKAIPNDKTKKEPNQDDLKTVLDPPRVDLPSEAAPPRCHLGGQNATKIDPKTIKNRSQKSRVKKTDPRRSWTRLGAILGRLGCHLGPTWTSKSCCGCSGARFFEKSIFRCSDGFGTNFGRPRRQNDRK